MRRSPAPLGLGTVVGTLMLGAISAGCAAPGRNTVMTPAGPRLLGRADPIAVGRPPAITYDPYQPDGIPRPTGLARYFPGPSVASPRAGKPAAPADRTPSPAPATALAERGEPSRLPAVRPQASPPIVLAGKARQDASVLPIGITLETFPAGPSSNDPETRLASRREPEQGEPGAFDLPVVEEVPRAAPGPTEVPDFRP